MQNEFLVRVITRRFECKALYKDSRVNESQWLVPTKYIDSDHPRIIEKAEDLTTPLDTRSEKAFKIIEFVSQYIEYDENRTFSWVTNQTYSGEVNSSASDVLKLRKGSCRHSSRLFVALCRASDVPARYVRGYKFSEVDSIGGHAWVEYLEDDKYWHIVEPQTRIFETFPEAYFHLIHGPNQNSSFYTESFSSRNCVIVEDTDEIHIDTGSPICTDYQVRSTISETFFPELTISIIIGQAGALGIGYFLRLYNEFNENDEYAS